MPLFLNVFSVSCLKCNAPGHRLFPAGNMWFYGIKAATNNGSFHLNISLAQWKLQAYSRDQRFGFQRWLSHLIYSLKATSHPGLNQELDLSPFFIADIRCLEYVFIHFLFLRGFVEDKCKIENASKAMKKILISTFQQLPLPFQLTSHSPLSLSTIHIIQCVPRKYLCR